MSVFTMPQGETAYEHIASQIGQGLGGGLQQGINSYFETKQQNEKQQQLLSALGLSGGGATATAGGPGAVGGGGPLGGLELTPEKVAAISLLDPQQGKAFAHLYDVQQKDKEFERTRSAKFLDEARTKSEGLVERRIAIDSAKKAVMSGEITPFGGDFWADVLNFPQLKTASGAALQTAAKTNLIGSLNAIPGARPNQYIEQQINNAFARAGQSKEANLAQINIIEAKLDIDEKMAEITRDLADFYKQQYGFIPEGLDRQVSRAIEPFAKQRMKELGYDLQELTEQSSGQDKLAEVKRVTKGTPLTRQKAEALLLKIQPLAANPDYIPTEEDDENVAKLATGLGYEIPPIEFYSRNQ